MSPNPTTNIRFKCPNCRAHAEVEAEVPEVELGDLERLSDAMSEDDIDLECPHCGATFSAHVQNTLSGCFVELDDHPDVAVTADHAPFGPGEPDPEDDWLYSDPPVNPYSVFLDAYSQLANILAAYGEEGNGVLIESGSVINRMVYSGVIGALEAFLHDTLTNKVLGERRFMEQLLHGDKQLKITTVTLSEIFVNPSAVEDVTRRYLGSLIYHNLAKIREIYRVAFGVDILPDADHRERLIRAVQTRHDIVHRNGRTKEGTTLDVRTSTVRETMNDVKLLAENVQTSVGEAQLRLLLEPKKS